MFAHLWCFAVLSRNVRSSGACFVKMLVIMAAVKFGGTKRYTDDVLHWFLVLTVKMKKSAGLTAYPKYIYYNLP